MNYKEIEKLYEVVTASGSILHVSSTYESWEHQNVVYGFSLGEYGIITHAFKNGTCIYNWEV